MGLQGGRVQLLGPGECWACGRPGSAEAGVLLQVGGQGQGPRGSFSRRAVQEAVQQQLAALQRSWEQDPGPARPLGPHRLVRSRDGTAAGQGLQAAEVIGMLRSQEACLEAVLHQLQGQCRQELARLAGALPALVWIPPPGR